MKKTHCCACTSSVSKKAVYCCIGKARLCARHKRWYNRRNELIAAGNKIDDKLRKMAKTF